MKAPDAVQYTIRGIPSAVDKVLRAKSKRLKQSLNTVAVEALAKGLGLEQQPVTYHDLDFLAGSWQEDPEFDAAIAAQDQVDPKDWE